MTKVMIEGFGWIYLVVVLDWHSKKVVGHYAGLQAAPGIGWSPSIAPATASSRAASRARA